MNAFAAPRPVWWAMLLVSVVYLLLAALFVVRVPDWQTPDEPAHVNSVRQLSEGHLPVIEDGDWDQAALEAYRAAGFREVTPQQIDAIEYEDHQPPLYYALLVPIYWLTDGDLTALRFASALWGLVIVWSAYGVARLLLPDRPWLAVTAAGFVAVQPMHLHILASVNNDALAWALVGVGLALGVATVKEVPLFGRRVPAWALGLLVGIGLVTKATTYFMAGVLALALLLRWWQTPERDRRALLREIGAYLLPALLLGGAWWLRNMIVYGPPDFLGLAAHDAVVVGQPRTQARIDALGFGGYLREISRTTFNSFWGQFGWMGLPLRETWYQVIALALGLIFIGLGLETARAARRDAARVPGQRFAWALLWLTALLSVLAYAYYNSEFQQYQGRYTFTLLVPLAVWLALGVDGWRGLALRDRRPWLTALAVLPLAAFSVYLIWRVIPTNL